MTTYYNPADNTAEQWIAKAAAAARSEQESWERSDTDGFLSQWASQNTNRMYRHLADLAAAGNAAEMSWLFAKDDSGEWVPVEDYKWVETRYGSSVLVNPGPNGEFFNPSRARKAATRQARDEAKGYRFGIIRAEVVCRFVGQYTLGIANERKRGAAITVVTTADYEHYDN